MLHNTEIENRYETWEMFENLFVCVYPQENYSQANNTKALSQPCF